MGGGDEGLYMDATEEIHVINCQLLSPCHCQWLRRPLQLGSAIRIHTIYRRRSFVKAELPTSKSETSVPSNLTATFVSEKFAQRR